MLVLLCFLLQWLTIVSKMIGIPLSAVIMAYIRQRRVASAGTAFEVTNETKTQVEA